MGTLRVDRDLLSTIEKMKPLTKRSQAAFLDAAESILIDRPDIFIKIRKLYLDNSNNYRRMWIKELLDDVIE